MKITAIKIRRSWVLAAGQYVLPGKFRTESAALEALAEKPSFYEYWAGSIGASVANSIPRVAEAWPATAHREPSPIPATTYHNDAKTNGLVESQK